MTVRYGIKTIIQDSTPGFRSTDEVRRWFDSEAERDAFFAYLTRKSDPLTEFMQNKGVYDAYTERSYYLIEETINDNPDVA